MELGTFERQLRLMVLLTQNRTYTTDEICRRLNIGWRTIYRYLELFRDMGFVVEKEDGKWRIDRSSPFFREITDRVHFNDEEAITLRRILDGISNTNLQARLLRNKLCRIYDFGLVDDLATDEALSRKLNMLYDAIKDRRVVVLHDYHSASSRTVANRVVEPYQMLHGGGEVRCFELSSGQCKIFKLTRIGGEVEIMDLLWSNADKHVRLHTDAFGFSGDTTHHVVLRLGTLAVDLLREEYPQAYEHCNDNILSIDVCSFLGLGRFVMGLPEEVEVLENNDFIEFLKGRRAYWQT